MIGGNYPEKERLTDGLELTLRCSDAAVLVPIGIAGLPQRGSDGLSAGASRRSEKGWQVLYGALGVGLFSLFSLA